MTTRDHAAVFREIIYEHIATHPDISAEDVATYVAGQARLNACQNVLRALTAAGCLSRMKVNKPAQRTASRVSWYYVYRVVGPLSLFKTELRRKTLKTLRKERAALLADRDAAHERANAIWQGRAAEAAKPPAPAPAPTINLPAAKAILEEGTNFESAFRDFVANQRFGDVMLMKRVINEVFA